MSRNETSIMQSGLWEHVLISKDFDSGSKFIRCYKETEVDFQFYELICAYIMVLIA